MKVGDILFLHRLRKQNFSLNGQGRLIELAAKPIKVKNVLKKNSSAEQEGHFMVQ